MAIPADRIIEVTFTCCEPQQTREIMLEVLLAYPDGLLCPVCDASVKPSNKSLEGLAEGETHIDVGPVG